MKSSHSVQIRMPIETLADLDYLAAKWGPIVPLSRSTTIVGLIRRAAAEQRQRDQADATATAKRKQTAAMSAKVRSAAATARKTR